MPSEIPIEVENLAKTYRLGFFLNKEVRALQELALRVEPGQIYGLLGPNGAGKSTTIKILMNLVRPSGGSARVFGQPPESHEARRRVGFLPENPAPYEYLSGREFVTLAGQLCGLSGKELDDRVKQVLGDVGMEKAANLHIRRYSKGMVQRIALAQAIVHRPQLLILDEPTSGLDPVGRRQTRELILAERERGTTILFCTHIISDVEAVCERVAVLVGGRRVREGSVRELLTTQAPVVEVAIEGLSLPQVRGFGHDLTFAQELEKRVLVRLSAEASQVLLRQVLESGGRVTQLQPTRYSLEDLFLDALKEARQGTVGGEFS